MRDDQMVLGIHRGLHVAAHDPRADAAVCHGTRIRIGERDLLVWSCFEKMESVS
jgi:hypothetical protein